MSESNIEFKFINLPDLLFFQEGPGVRKHQFTNSGVKLLNGGNINNNQLDLTTTDKFISKEEAYGRYKHFLVDEGDLVIASSGVVVSKFDGKIAFVDKSHLPLCMNTSTIRFKVLDETKFDIKYFYFFLKHNLFKNQIQRLITGSAQLNFGPTHLKKIKIPIPYKDGKPDLLTQKRIAKILSHTETLIAKRKESIQMLDEFVKATFLEMFGDPVRNKKGWELVLLSDLGSIARGVSKHRPRNAPELLNGNHPLIQTGDIANSGIYITKYHQTYSDIGLMQSKKWAKGTLCITIAANIAKTGILTFDACFPDSIVGFIADTQVTNSLYIHNLFLFFQRILEKNAPAAAQKNINLNILRNLKVPKPPLPLQKQFAEIVEKTENLKKQFEQSLQELQNLYGSLSQRAFKGELDLSKVKIEDTEEPEQREEPMDKEIKQ